MKTSHSFLIYYVKVDKLNKTKVCVQHSVVLNSLYNNNMKINNNINEKKDVKCSVLFL